MENLCGYMGKIARIDVEIKACTYENLDEKVTHKFYGGTGLGLYYLYNEVPPEVMPFDPQNRFIIMTGPLTGTIGPTGTYNVSTKGAMTCGPSDTQANGFFGAFLKSNALDGMIIQGSSENMVYIYVHDDIVEIKDGEHLRRLDTMDVVDCLEEELGGNKKTMSVMAIGPSGENGVRFACVVSDRGHVAAHNGTGAILGSKNVKAVVVKKGTNRVQMKDRKLAGSIFKDALDNNIRKHPGKYYEDGTSNQILMYDDISSLPFKNYSQLEDVKKYAKLEGRYYREHFEMESDACYGCSFKHCHRIRVTEGPYTGLATEEPEYEQMSSWGPLIGQTDLSSAVALSDLVDRLGMDTNETGWIIAWVMECYEKGLFTKETTDGIDMNWGNVDSAMEMIKKIAYREGFGNLLSEGLARAAKSIGGEAADLGVYTVQGNTPRTHDHRNLWSHMIDTSISTTGTDVIGVLLANPALLGLPPETDRFSAEGAAALAAAAAKKGYKTFLDSAILCMLGITGAQPSQIAELFNAVTGRDITVKDIDSYGYMMHNFFRAFAVRHGRTKEMDAPSKRYASSSLKGPGSEFELYKVWDEARSKYYEYMGWDENGVPKPEILSKVGLNFIIKDIWTESY